MIQRREAPHTPRPCLGQIFALVFPIAMMTVVLAALICLKNHEVNFS
jgi:hypothetical protein